MNTPGPYLGEAFALLAAVVWAFAVILFRKSGQTVHPVALNLFKNLLTLFLLFPTFRLFHQSFTYTAPPKEYMLLLLSGAVGLGIADTLYFKSLNLLGAGLMAIVACLYCPFVITLSLIFLKETLTWLQVLGIFLIVSALLIVSYEKRSAKIDPRNLVLGILLGIAAAFSIATSIVIIKPLLERSPLLWVAEVRLFGGIVVLAFILLFSSSRKSIIASLASKQSWGYTLGGSFLGSYVAMFLWLAGMKYTQASIASALNETSVIFTFIFAALFLKEPANLRRVVGVLFAFAGSFLVSFG